MAVVDTEALILRTYNLAEADKIVVCLTKVAGLIRGVAKGCRKLRNRFGASLEPFTFIQLTYYERENQELVSFRQTEILKSNFNLSTDPSIVTGLAYLGDLLIEFSPPHQANELLFRMASACFDAIGHNPEDLQSILRYFEVWILKIEGFMPDLKVCGECHRPFASEESLYISSSDMQLRCRDCSHGRGGTVSQLLHAHLRTTEKLSPAKFAEGSRGVPLKTRRELAELTHQMIGRVLERLPRVRPNFVQ
jgi:DNA repair protein RecO (recombination protein O)